VLGLLTDYGPGSEHVGALHAVVAAGVPGADRIDLAHDLPAGDIAQGALVLAELVGLVPPGAVVVAVVDPGVGGARRGLAVTGAGGTRLVGPDNGLLGPAAQALHAAQAVELTSRRHRRHPVAPTFHGRDVFVPAAVHLMRGGRPEDLGPAVDPASIRDPGLPEPRVTPGRVVSSVLGVDRFGNVSLVAGAAALAASGLTPGHEVRVGGHAALVARTFSEVPAGGLIVLVDGHGRVALAVSRGRAAERLGLSPGDEVTITRAG
jgi:hypothetical protein